MRKLSAEFKAKLEETGLAHESITVMTASGLSVIVTCIGEATARKWADLLGTVCPTGRLVMKPTILDAPHSKKGRMWKHKKGYLIVVNDRT